jgi:serine/threonine protein phosphatase 1
VRKSKPVKSKDQHPQIPDGIRVYAIGDIHGRGDLLEQVLSRIDADLSSYPAARSIQVFLGDYVDRGPSSRHVLDKLIERSRTHETINLRGNHEAMVMQFLEDPDFLDQWRRFGGIETLISYGLVPSMRNDPIERERLAGALAQALSTEHRAFLQNLAPCFVCGDYFFVHAGVRPGIPLARQREQDMLWIRDDFLVHEENYSKVVVHGHTPVLRPDIRPNRINIDTGAYATGRLSCLALERDELLFI